MRISRHITQREALRSMTAKRRGISNIPNEIQIENLKEIANKVYEPLREHFGVKIYIGSMFRSLVLNKALRGARNSQHMANKGAAMDLDADVYEMVTNEEIFTYIKDNLVFDQLISEGVENGHIEWVHCSYNNNKNRKQVLIMYRENGKSKYLPYTEEALNNFLNKE